MKILVAGATGALGSLIVKKLRARDHQVFALVRQAKRESAAALGAEVIVGDVTDRASLDRAVAGMDAVVSTITSIQSSKNFKAVDRDGNLALVAAAKNAGVKTFVFVSASQGRFSRETPLMRAKQAVEAAIAQSGMAWAVLQPSLFMEIWLGAFFGWDARKATAQVFGKGDAPLAYIATPDVADFAVACLERPTNRLLPLGGPRELSQNEAVRAFEQVTGKAFKVKRTPAAVFKIMRAVAGPFSDFFASVSGLTLQAIAGDSIPGAAAVAKEYGVTLTSVEAYVKQLLA